MRLPFWKFSKYRLSKNFLKYTTLQDLEEAARRGEGISHASPVSREGINSTTADWSRNMDSYYIATYNAHGRLQEKSVQDILLSYENGTPSQQILFQSMVSRHINHETGQTVLNFRDDNAIKTFFDHCIFKHVLDNSQRDLLINRAFDNFYQRGLIHATLNAVNIEVRTAYANNTKLPLEFPANPKVVFIPTNKGVIIHELNTFYKNNEDKDLNINSVAHLSSRVSFNINPNKHHPNLTCVNAEVHDVVVDLKDKSYAYAFGSRSLLQKIKNFFESIFKLNKFIDTKETTQYKRLKIS